MKHINLIIVLALLFASCSKNDDNNESQNELSGKNNILKFSFEEFKTRATINNVENAINIFAPFTDENITSLTPLIEISENATIEPSSGVTMDFSNEISFTVTAENGSVNVYSINLIEKLKSALLIIDVQNANFPTYNQDDFLANINNLRTKAYNAGQPVIYIQHCGRGDWEINTSTWQINGFVAPNDDDYVVYKTQVDGFTSEEFKNLIEELNVYKLIFTGTKTDLCIEQTIKSGYKEGYHLVLIEDGHSTNSSNPSNVISDYNKEFQDEEYGELIKSDDFDFDNSINN